MRARAVRPSLNPVLLGSAHRDDVSARPPRAHFNPRLSPAHGRSYRCIPALRDDRLHHRVGMGGRRRSRRDEEPGRFGRRVHARAGGVCAVGGYGSALADLYITVEEFVPLAPVDLDDDVVTTFGPGAQPGDATIASPRNPLAGRQFLRSFSSGRTTIIRQWTAALGLQVLDQSSFAVITFVMPITPGNSYRCWLYADQSAACMSPGPAGWAYSYFFLDLRPVFFAFTE